MINGISKVEFEILASATAVFDHLPPCGCRYIAKQPKVFRTPIAFVFRLRSEDMNSGREASPLCSALLLRHLLSGPRDSRPSTEVFADRRTLARHLPRLRWKLSLSLFSFGPWKRKRRLDTNQKIRRRPP